ncbi:saccharopine dehydrogenase [Picosynechococcus sp. PCC 11901]|uniref:saccharopine dehydrogenase family protein n=1 Tax=Picosynechococcus sp. PCC 11901 TaxID=2579791 RepID=UPI0010FC0D18|nr:saccharopine dehydrogenase NADP-binding domain-containing protein [Picosynechococcus sp. PCC 11901]QCS48785.1 saccharopine dehydrogenase [Picosynechococcus sp. PCC 11901]
MSSEKMSSSSPPYDLIVVGATGFVGQIICRYLCDHAERESFTWAIAGRSAEKLAQLKHSLGIPGETLATFVVDVFDQGTVTALCEQTKVILTTVGPYSLYGETLLRACATTGTDYCDLTGEVQWVKKMVTKYEAIAQQSGARIVHCCGFDSVPSDLGVYFLQQRALERFGEPCRQIKMRVKAAQGGISGGTAASGVNLIKEAIADPEIKALLANPYALCPKAPNPQHPVPLIPVQIDHTFGEWVTPFIMAAVNTPIVLRSNALQNWAYGEQFQYDEGLLTGVSVGGWLKAQGLSLLLKILGGTAAIAPGILEKIVPAPGEGPSPSQQQAGFYDLRFWGTTASGETLMAKVTGDRDPGYGSTAKIIAQAGLCLAKDHLSRPGGFWTPATGMGEPLIERLTTYSGLTFSIL